ncbi:MAG: tRNA (adenosine(37)-N6)-threonylcarbamoyltransferase complex ATPase subunit type 1 TsaE [Granulosicoccus sp.]|nr:tRNA (adenosine(37)-N6)-threonylcarbamoyltransferase complex ATPase subunit type 1 TsaE [Granulosicoccus sp.]
MHRLGILLADVLPRPSLVTLSGELGAGKSVLARSIIHALGYTGRVKSPTYTLLESYDTVDAKGNSWQIAHMDLFRLTDPEELDYLGFDDVIRDHDLVLVEWPDKGGDRIPAAHLHIEIRYAGEDSRRVVFTVP